MSRRTMRRNFHPSLDVLPSRIAPTVFVPPPPMPLDIDPPTIMMDPPTTYSVPSDSMDMTPPDITP
ncbi:MAG: hypothetical protein JWN86_2565 [Planctomycetota bacterium]|nr:hypothetical protein [Planctomycetota bacterium]